MLSTEKLFVVYLNGSKFHLEILRGANSRQRGVRKGILYSVHQPTQVLLLILTPKLHARSRPQKQS